MHRDEVEARRSARLDTLVALDRLAGFGPGPATRFEADWALRSLEEVGRVLGRR